MAFGEQIDGFTLMIKVQRVLDEFIQTFLAALYSGWLIFVRLPISTRLHFAQKDFEEEVLQVKTCR